MKGRQTCSSSMSAGTSVTVSRGWNEKGKREGATAVASLMGRCTYSQHTLFVLLLSTSNVRLRFSSLSSTGMVSSAKAQMLLSWSSHKYSRKSAQLHRSLLLLLLYCRTNPQQQQGLLGSMHMRVCGAVARGEDDIAHQDHCQAGHAGQRHNLALQLEEHIGGQHLLQRLPFWIKWVFQPWQGPYRRREYLHI